MRALASGGQVHGPAKAFMKPSSTLGHNGSGMRKCISLSAVAKEAHRRRTRARLSKWSIAHPLRLNTADQGQRWHDADREPVDSVPGPDRQRGK
jgi:hypothetical protein